jgi:hypothetical protein
MLAVSSIAFSPIVSAQSNQLTASVNLNYLTVQVTYPSDVLPGQTITAHVQATAKSSFHLVALTAQIFYADGSSIQQLGTKTLASDTSLASGKSISGDVSITVPQSAPRTSLVAAFSENARVTNTYYSTYSSYYYYPTGYTYYYYPYAYYYGNYTYYYYPYMYYYTNYSSPYYYYCYGYGCSYPSSYYSYYKYYSSYPANSYSYTTDVGITSMPYIKATTPEEQNLQTQNQQLQQQLNQSQASNQQLQQQLSQSQADNQQLQQQLQDAKSKIDQQNSTNTDLNQQLTSNKNLTYGLGGLAGLFAILAAYFRRGRGKIGYPQQQYSPANQPSTPTS